MTNKVELQSPSIRAALSSDLIKARQGNQLSSSLCCTNHTIIWASSDMLYQKSAITGLLMAVAGDKMADNERVLAVMVIRWWSGCNLMYG